VREYEYVSLGPLDWLVAEAACSEACSSVLGIRINPEHVRVLSEVARECGVVYAFERLCVICERPKTVERSADGVTAMFRDGARVATTR
jgi:hypothetical protein